MAITFAVTTAVLLVALLLQIGSNRELRRENFRLTKEQLRLTDGLAVITDSAKRCEEIVTRFPAPSR